MTGDPKNDRPSKVVLLALLTAVVVVPGYFLGWQPVDDAYISFRYAENWSQGNGLVFNHGERVEGYTNFLWTALLALGSLVGFDIPILSCALGCAFAIGALFLTFLIANQVAEERKLPPSMPYVAVAILALYPGWSYWAWSGMEGPMATFFLLAFFFLGAQRIEGWRSAVLVGITGACAAMTRWECILFWPHIIVFQLFYFERSGQATTKAVARIAVTCGAIFGVYYWIRYAYYGEWFPNTFYCKSGGSWWARLPGGLIHLGELGVCWMLPITGIAWLMRGMRRWTFLIVAALSVAGIYVTWTGGDFYPWLRFYLPILPFCAILAAAFVENTVKWVAETSKSRMRCASCLTLILAINSIGYALDYDDATEHIELTLGWRAVGLWAREKFPEHYRLAVAPIGMIGYHSRHPIVDLLGLTEYEVAHHGNTDPREAAGHQRANKEAVLRRKSEVFLGNAPLFRHIPTENEVYKQSRRRAVFEILEDPRFREVYEFHVSPIGDMWFGYWQLRSTNEVK